MGRDVYANDWLKGAAMLESLALHEPLEAKSEFFAWLVAETFLNANGVTLNYEPEEALALVIRVKHKGAVVQEVAAQLRAWSTGGRAGSIQGLSVSVGRHLEGDGLLNGMRARALSGDRWPPSPRHSAARSCTSRPRRGPWVSDLVLLLRSCRGGRRPRGRA